MKLVFEFSIMDMGDGKFAAVPVGENSKYFHGMLELNAVSAEIMQQINEGEKTLRQLHNHLKEKYPASTDDEIGQILVGFLNQLFRAGLLIPSPNDGERTIPPEQAEDKPSPNDGD